MQARKLFLAAAVSAMVSAAAGATVNPFEKEDDSWISLGGVIVDPEATSFLLDYGKGVIRVEMDDWDSYPETYGLLEGDRVTVYGKIDDDLFEVTKIEAGAVYVEGLSAYFYASSEDEESQVLIPYYWTEPVVAVPNNVTLRGTVTEVDEKARSFVIDRGAGALTVETDEMPYNPLDELGFQQIEAGDVVSVTGNIDYDFFDNRVLEAERITTLLGS